MPRIKNIAAVAGVVEAARRYGQNNPEKTRSYIDKAAAFVDKRTNGKYSRHISGIADKAAGFATGNRGGQTNAWPNDTRQGGGTQRVVPGEATDGTPRQF